MDFGVLSWLIGAICGAGAVLAGGAFWLGRHVSGVETTITTLTNDLGALVKAMKDIGDELKKRDETFWKELEKRGENLDKEFEKRDNRIEALGKRHDELKERVVIIEHEIKR